MPSMEKLMDKIDYTFKNIDWLHRALIHRSYSSGVNNERLEFLGDAILGLVVAEALFLRDRDVKEGRLSRMRAALVNGEILAQLGRQLGLQDYISLGSGELKSGGRERESIISDAFEALIGAIYLDSGLSAAKDFVSAQYGDRLIKVIKLTTNKDAKSELQEWAQQHKHALPTYSCEVSGLAHAQIFTVTCQVDGFNITGHGSGSSTRRAEKLAARNFLEKMNEM
jgi:ribonuclease III